MLGYHAATVTRYDSMTDFGACLCCGYSAAGEPFGAYPYRGYSAAVGEPFWLLPLPRVQGRQADYFIILPLILLLTLEPPPCRSSSSAP